MTPKCPYCGGELVGAAALPAMPRRQYRIYQAVTAAGPGGIAPSDLLVRMYAENEWPTPGGGVVLRVQIHELNKRLAQIGQRILSSPYKAYRLVTTEGEVHGKTAEETQDGSSNPSHHPDSGT